MERAAAVIKGLSCRLRGYGAKCSRQAEGLIDALTAAPESVLQAPGTVADIRYILTIDTATPETTAALAALEA